MRFAELRGSTLVSGPPEEQPEGWDAPWRHHLVDQAETLVNQLWQVGITDVFLDGSFAEDKPHSNDIDEYFHCDAHELSSGNLQRRLNTLDPESAWTWDHDARRSYWGYVKKQLPMWHAYRVELYPHYDFGPPTGIRDENGNRLLFPAAFRRQRGTDHEKGIVKVIPGAFAEKLLSPMIRTDAEHRKALEQLDEDADAIDAQRAHLEDLGIEDEDLERALQPAVSFRKQLEEEGETYERMERGDLGTLESLRGIGRWLVGARIALGLTQQELAERLDVSASQVSRDERNDYHGITVDRAQRIMDALGIRFQAHAENVLDRRRAHA